ncbi:MAG: formylglycine-generating enzyme family protein [Bacteroidota bacterium]|nr:formylglycine-generating enzyme family protein [Bacteroidota bacterium]MDP4232438.1 formylglycine-generating enzyme family protein [Bacteroidota bacterium]MDP4241574.1 formylglycine-generating enzyme family protein [Bacteroidota bacterium]MDP4286318.1 formylglycine-generating enzyme family protein [Bacteroidota bacterium]
MIAIHRLALSFLLLAALSVSCVPGFSKVRPAQSRAVESSRGMVRIPSGYYKPFYITKGIDSVFIHSFLMDATPVTNKEFLDFVKSNTSWTRSRVSSLLAESGYLKHWKGDFDIGDKSLEGVPVVNVSWFAASAYARWRHKRLPTISEWEYASLAPIVSPRHSTGKAKNDLILAWYGSPNASRLHPAGTVNKNAYGVCDMFGQVWDWVEDFSSVIIPPDPRGGLDLRSFCGAGAAGTIDPSDYATFMRFAMRNSLKANYCVENLGFRCVQ